MGQREIEKRQKVAELVRQLVDETNTMGFESEVALGIEDGLVTSHRTLQQSFMRAFVKAMEGYACVNTDLRNEGAVALAKKISELEERHLPFV